MTIILLLVGLGLIVLGADWLVDGSHSGRKCRIDRWEGAVMLLVFAAYYCYLFVKL